MIYGYNSKLSNRGTNTIRDYCRKFLEEIRKVRNTDQVRNVMSFAFGNMKELVFGSASSWDWLILRRVLLSVGVFRTSLNVLVGYYRVVQFVYTLIICWRVRCTHTATGTPLDSGPFVLQAKNRAN